MLQEGVNNGVEMIGLREGDGQIDGDEEGIGKKGVGRSMGCWMGGKVSEKAGRELREQMVDWMTGWVMKMIIH